jgi:hypothetical protein
MLYTSPWSGFEPTTSVVIVTDSIGSCILQLSYEHGPHDCYCSVHVCVTNVYNFSYCLFERMVFIVYLYLYCIWNSVNNMTILGTNKLIYSLSHISVSVSIHDFEFYRFVDNVTVQHHCLSCLLYFTTICILQTISWII